MNIEKYTQNAQQAIMDSQNIAISEGHQVLECEHLHMALLQQQDGLIGKLLLDDEGHRDLVALVEVLVGDKAVHLRPQRDRLDERGHDQMEHRIGEFRFCFVLFLEIRVHIGEVDRLADVGLIVAAVRVDQRRNEVHPVEITEQHTIFPVAPATFFLFHFKSHTFLTESRQQCLYDTKERQEMQA